MQVNKLLNRHNKQVRQITKFIFTIEYEKDLHPEEFDIFFPDWEPILDERKIKQKNKIKTN